MKVICTLPNASSEISGVKFVPHPDKPGAMVSEDISEDQAALFAAIPGYELVGAKKEPVVPQGGPAAGEGAAAAGDAAAAAAGAKPGDKDGNGVPDADELAALRKEGAELGIPHAEAKGLKRLREEVPAARKAKAEGAGAA